MLMFLRTNASRYHFFDSDALVEQAAGKTVAAIFAEDGEGDFREAESSVIQARVPSDAGRQAHLIILAWIVHAGACSGVSDGGRVRPEQLQCVIEPFTRI